MDKFDQAQARAEGWEIVADAGGYQLRLAAESSLVSDYEAWAIVTGQARRGSRYHQQALDTLAMLNPTEREMILEATGF